MLETVSVSTVIVWVEPSGLVFPCLADMALDCRATGGGGTEVVRRSTMLGALSLPLSVVGRLGRALKVRPPSLRAVSDSGSVTWSFSLTLSANSESRAGVATSCTVSRPVRTGVRTPEAGLDSSVSLSDGVGVDCASAGLAAGLACWTLIAGGSGSGRVGVKAALVRFGGGERRRGETGHLGLSFWSDAAVFF